ncbi:MAG: hypothetical protein JOZ47_21155 [Kutzneria sp.]|nr:hypothetical protein [Kutzneria sp.]
MMVPPPFWLAHSVFGPPPGTDHVHQVVLLVLSLAGSLLPIREFCPGASSPDQPWAAR